MAISLVKGGNLALSGLKKVNVGLGWTVRSTGGDNFDLDATCFMLAANDKVRSDSDFIFYGHLKSPCGSVEHMGDNLVGGDGNEDDERIVVDLEQVASKIQRIVFAVSIYEAETRRQNFGMVRTAFIRIVDAVNQEEIARFDLSEDASTDTALLFGELYRRGNEWKFRALGEGVLGGLHKVATMFGVEVK